MFKYSKIKISHVYIALLIILAMFMIRNSFGLYKVQYQGDATNYFFPNELIIKESFLKGTMPLWNPFVMSGTPLLAKAQLPVLSLYTIIEIISPTPYLATTINALVHLLILVLGVYLLSRTVGIKPKYAFISAIVCMFSAYVSYSLFFAFYQFMGLAFFPYVIMFTIKGLESKKWTKYAILSSIFISMEFFSGAFEVFIFSWFAVAYLILFNLVGKEFSKRLLRSVFFGILFAIVAVCLVSIKLLPAIELANISNRQQPFDFETFIGAHLTLQNAFSTLIDERDLPNFIDHAVKGKSSVSIGIAASLLILISLFNFRKRRCLLFLGMAVLAILMVTNSPWNYLLWKYFPYFNKQKHVLKAQFVFLIAASILVAYGAQYLISKIKDKKLSRISYIALIVVIILTSWGFTYNIKMKDARPEIESVEIMKYIAKDNSLFRFKAWETNGIDWGTNYYSVHYGLQDVYGFENLWLIDYLPIFLSVANRDPAKFFGMLNMKYMTSMEELNISGFELIKKFDDNLINCAYINGEITDFNKIEQCPSYEILKKAWGPYLYLNKRFLPRIYAVKNSVLVVGEKESKMQAAYWLMLNNNFKPENSAIFIGKENINDYSINDLKRYKVIFLTQGSINERSGHILKAYVDNGGVLMPDVIGGRTSVTEKDLEKVWGSFKGNLTAVDDKDYVTHNFNKYELNLNGKYQGMFLVLSEKFSMFPGWTAKADGKTIAIEKVDGVVSAVYIDEPYKSVVFEYKPRTYIIGKNITIVTVILILIYIGCCFVKKSPAGRLTNF